MILRIAAAANAIAQGVLILAVSGTTASFSPIVGLFAVVAGVAFLIGFMTPIVGTILGLGYLIDAVSLFVGNGAPEPASALIASYLTIISFALALTGPGAFSVDARLFDRVEIIIPDRRRPPSDCSR